jgi:hypothetical protein
MVGVSTVRQLLARHGPTRPQEAADWVGTFPLPASVERYYREVGPVDIEIPGYGNPYFLPSLAGLWDLQEGYRWDGTTKERLPEWPDDWLVVAYEGGDAFIFDCATSAITLAAHGTGSWDPFDAFPSINAMAGALAILGSVVVAAGASFTDADSRIRPEHREAAAAALTQLLGTEDDADNVLGLLGWG